MLRDSVLIIKRTYSRRIWVYEANFALISHGENLSPSAKPKMHLGKVSVFLHSPVRSHLELVSTGLVDW